MFVPKTVKMKAIAELYPERIAELEKFFSNSSIVYIDWTNVVHTQERLGWNFDIRRIKQFFDSFNQIKKVRIYCGTLDGNQKSESQVRQLEEMHYVVTTKPVKLMKISIDISSIPQDSPSILKNFIRKSLLKRLDLETVAFLNSKLENLNKNGIFKLEDQKCNFDVEIGRDMLSDFMGGENASFVLWSGDSDFWSPIKQLKEDGKKVVIFSTSGRVSPEINSLGVPIFDVRKIKEFICWPKHLSPSIKTKIALL